MIFAIDSSFSYNEAQRSDLLKKIQRIRPKNCFNYWTYWVGIICTDVCFIYSANY